MLSTDIAEVQPLYGLCVFLRASSMSRQMLRMSHRT
jgi:hypothetical protein